MYNLNYTYLTELEVDTRQTFADLCDDLLLVNMTKESRPETPEIVETEALKASMTTLVTSWQDYFWKFDTNAKKNFNVTFTDISIYRHEISSDRDGNGYPLNADEMMSFKELSAYFKDMDGDGQPGHGKWCGDNHWTFSELCCTLINAIDALHDRLLEKDNIYPVGSMILSKSSPSGFGKWTKQNQSYLSEQITEISGFKMGFNSGRAMNSDVGSNLESVIVKPNPQGVPKHEHKIEFDPPSGGNSGSDSGEAGSGLATVKALKAGQNPPPNMSGQWLVNPGNWMKALAVPRDTNATIERGGDAHGDMTAIETEVTAENQNGINVSPKTYPINGVVWERTE